MGRPGSHSKTKKATEDTAAVLPSIGRQAKVVSVPTVAIGMGLACFLAWFKMLFANTNVFAGFDDPTRMFEATYLTSLVTTAITLWLLGVFHVPCSRVLGTGAARVAVPTCVALGTGVLALAAAGGPWGTACAVAGGVATGVASACLNVIYGVSFSLLPTKHTVATCVVGFATADVLVLLYQLLTPGQALAACVLAAPLGMLLWSYGFKCFDLTGVAYDPLPPQATPEDPVERKDARAVQLTFAALLVVAGCVYELLRVLYAQLAANMGTDDGSLAMPQAGGAFLIMAFMLVVGFLLMRFKRRSGPIGCYRTILVLLVMNALAATMPLVFPALSPSVPFAINTASYDCLAMLMWVLVTGICGQYPLTCFRIFSYMRAAWTMGPLLGVVLGKLVIATCELNVQTMTCVATACVLALLATGTFVFSENMMNKALNILPTENKRHFMERCEAVIRDFGLSEREGEIMIMFAKGRNLPYVQQELCLSKSTVSTHRQHIYQKLGVHRVQEMLDLIQEYKA